MAHEATILLVEDHRPTAEATVELLSEAGFGVLAASTLAGARDALNRHQVDLAVLDVHLPDGDSLELLEELQRTDDGVPSLVVSSDDRATVRNRAMEVGGSAFLKKPINPNHMLRAVRRLLDGSATPA